MALCECGCGKETKVAIRNQASKGHVKGEPMRFTIGHYAGRAKMRLGKKRVVVAIGYRAVTVDGADHNVRIHRVRAEMALGKPLPKKSVVHHADGSKSDTAPLVICQDSAYHSLLHRRTRIVKAGGDPNTDAWCSRCKSTKPMSSFAAKKNCGNSSPFQGNCRECSAAIQRTRRHTYSTTKESA